MTRGDLQRWERSFRKKKMAGQRQGAKRQPVIVRLAAC